MWHFRGHIVLRLLLSLALGGAAVYCGIYTPYWLLSGWLVLFFVMMVVHLIYFVERSERALGQFLLSIRQGDFANTYPKVGQENKSWSHAFHLITQEFIRIRNEKESNFHFLNAVVEHSGVPLMAYEVDTEVIRLLNQSLKDLLRMPYFTRLGSLAHIDSNLVHQVRQLRAGHKVLVRIQVQGERMHLSIQSRELMVKGVRHRVVAFHDINSELDQKELEAWQKLIQVMSHEIKNSVIPIATLAEVMNDLLEAGSGESRREVLGEEDMEDLLVSMKTIEKRSKGLVQFVTNYGDLAKVPKPQLRLVDLEVLVADLVSLERQELGKSEVSIELQVSPGGDWQVMMDREMMDQVVINLIKNAHEALLECQRAERTVTLRLTSIGNEVVLQVQDNGPGMDEETQDQVFVPFFTTKKEGSGIGLSYSHQVVRAHKGSLKVRSKIGEGTIFELRFWKANE